MATWNQILDPWVYILLRKAVLRKIFVLLHGCCGSKFYTLHRWQRSMLHNSAETSSSSGSSDCRFLGKTPVHNVVIKSITWTLSWVFYLRTPRCWKTKGKKIIWNTRRTFLKSAYPKVNFKGLKQNSFDSSFACALPLCKVSSRFSSCRWIRRTETLEDYQKCTYTNHKCFLVTFAKWSP